MHFHSGSGTFLWLRAYSSAVDNKAHMMARSLLVSLTVLPVLAACAAFQASAKSGAFIVCVNNLDTDLFNIEHPPG
jgi:hypothetical protein